MTIRVQCDTSDASVRLAGATDDRPQLANVRVTWPEVRYLHKAVAEQAPSKRLLWPGDQVPSLVRSGARQRSSTMKQARS